MIVPIPRLYPVVRPQLHCFIDLRTLGPLPGSILPYPRLQQIPVDANEESESEHRPEDRLELVSVNEESEPEHRPEHRLELVSGNCFTVKNNKYLIKF